MKWKCFTPLRLGKAGGEVEKDWEWVEEGMCGVMGEGMGGVTG